MTRRSSALRGVLRLAVRRVSRLAGVSPGSLVRLTSQEQRAVTLGAELKRFVRMLLYAMVVVILPMLNGAWLAARQV